MQLRISIPYYLFFFRLCSLFHKDCDINSAYEQYAVLWCLVFNWGGTIGLILQIWFFLFVRELHPLGSVRTANNRGHLNASVCTADSVDPDTCWEWSKTWFPLHKIPLVETVGLSNILKADDWGPTVPLNISVLLWCNLQNAFSLDLKPNPNFLLYFQITFVNNSIFNFYDKQKSISS